MVGESDQTRWVGTRKVYPALIDMQAPEAIINWYDKYPFVAGGTVTRYSGTVPGGKMWVITGITSYCQTVGNHQAHSIYTLLVINYRMRYQRNLGAYIPSVSSGIYLLDEGQRIGSTFNGVGAGHDCYSSCGGYQISKY